MTTKNRNDNGSDHLFYASVFSIALAFASFFGVFVATVFGIFAPLLPTLLAVGAVVCMTIGMGMLMMSSIEFWSSAIQHSVK